MTRPIDTADRVLAARKALGMTQQQVADALRLQGENAKDTVRSWEKNRRPISGPSQVALELLLELRGLSIDVDQPSTFDRICEAVRSPSAVVGGRWKEEGETEHVARAVQAALRKREKPAPPPKMSTAELLQRQELLRKGELPEAERPRASTGPFGQAPQ